MSERRIGLISANYVLLWARLCSQLFGSDPLKAIIFATITQANTGHLDQHPETSRAWGVAERPPPDELRRRVTLYAVASALGVSRETLRRKVKALVREGYLAEDAGGVYVPPEATVTPRTLEVLRANTALARDFYLELTAAGVGQSSSSSPAPSPEVRLDRAIGRLTNTFCLRFLDNLACLGGGDVMLGLTACALEVSGTRHLLERPELLPPGRATPLPDAARKPVTALALSRELAIPRETARRHLHWWISRGVVRSVSGGFILSEQHFDWTPMGVLFSRTKANARQLEAGLRRTGILLPDA